ncbi:MAG: hypothetical protein O2991_04790 [Bacteroidetes bacterium]|nr:hypothetical protein [Bacteroidota bacterium]MDA0906883.1 hypothetical protein [Bacteroidota bacterium]
MKRALQSISQPKLSFLLILSAITLAGTTASAQDNIIANGDFSTGDLTSWTTYFADFAGVSGGSP